MALVFRQYRRLNDRSVQSHWLLFDPSASPRLSEGPLSANIQVPPRIRAVSGQMVLPSYNMTDRLDSPVAPSGSGGLGAAICSVPFPS